MPKPARIAGLLTVALATAGLLTGAVPSAPVTPAAAAGSLIPFLDCVSHDPGTGLDTAWFGYANTTGSAADVTVGPSNQVVGGNGGNLDEGQPAHFNAGVYPRVFSASYTPAANALVVWQLNGELAQANSSSPACSPGVTMPASAVTATTATINGVVLPGGDDTTWQFSVSSPGAARQRLVRAAADAGSGTLPVPVHLDLTGLTPGATYYYRLDTTNSAGTSESQQLSFTTAGAPVSVTTTALPAGKRGSRYSAALAAGGGATPYQWVITQGHLPAGLSLARATGVISGRLKSTARTATFTVTVIDSSSPTRQAASSVLSITVH